MTIVLCPVAAIPDGGTRGFKLAQTQLFAVRSGGRVSVYLNRCPHLGIRLNWQEHGFLDHENAFVQCATHGALFEKHTGLCIQGPCRGENLWQIICNVNAGNVEIDESELPLESQASLQ